LSTKNRVLRQPRDRQADADANGACRRFATSATAEFGLSFDFENVLDVDAQTI
jgi:hypothetical protein